MEYKDLISYLPDFIDAIRNQLVDDSKRWGDTWKQRPREGQELRVQARYNDYFAQFQNAGTPIPWLKVAGEAFIAWVRENNSKT